MIDKYAVKNFKIHKDTYEFDLHGLTVFTGTNSSGKSSITQSIRTLALVNEKSLNYPKLPLGDMIELKDLSRTLNKKVSQKESITYRLGLDVKGLRFCEVEIEFKSAYNYEYVFFDMLDDVVMDRMNIYFKNENSLEKEYEFTIRMNDNGVMYELEEVELERRIKVEVQDQILFRGLYANFIPAKLDEGIMELMRTMQILGNINTKKIKYLPALRDITGVADIMNRYANRMIFDEKVTFQEAFNKWMKKLLNAKFGVKIQNGDAKIVEIEDDIEFELEQIGFGNSQILPIIVAVLTAQKGDLIIIENPEVHLHPKWKTNLIEFLYYATQNGINVLVETQSLEIINRIRVMIKKNNKLANDTALYFFEKRGLEANVQKIAIEETGNLEIWPDDFLDKVTMEDSFELL